MKKFVTTAVMLLIAFSVPAQDDEQAAQGASAQASISAGASGSAADGGDAGVVAAILQRNNLSGVQLENIASFAGGRIIKLNLDNPEPGKPGISAIGPEIARLSALTELTINDNDLVAIPDEIGALTSLRRLEVKNNALVSLPSTIGNLDGLEELDLRNNELTSLPLEIGLCRRLWKLQLWGNSLRSLPPAMGALSALRELYLRGNRIQTFPAEIRKLKLGYIDVQENRLCEVPADIDIWLKKFDPKYRSWQKCW